MESITAHVVSASSQPTIDAEVANELEHFAVDSHSVVMPGSVQAEVSLEGSDNVNNLDTSSFNDDQMEQNEFFFEEAIKAELEATVDLGPGSAGTGGPRNPPLGLPEGSIVSVTITGIENGIVEYEVGVTIIHSLDSTSTSGSGTSIGTNIWMQQSNPQLLQHNHKRIL